MQRSKVRAPNQLTWVLHRPDTYIGSCVRDVYNEFVFNSGKFEYKKINYTPGFLRVLIEALANSVDNVQRGREQGIPCTMINIKWVFGENEITIENDGPVPEIKKHEREADEDHDVDGIYEPQLLFGRLMAGTNFDDIPTGGGGKKQTKERVVSGRNGVGVSLLNIFSKKFVLTINNASDKKSYTQEWSDNMKNVKPPVIKSYSGKKNLIRVVFIPDIERFHYTNVDEDFYNLFKKQVYDAAMLTKIKVSFNDELIKIGSLLDYTKYYIQEEPLYHQLFTAKTTTTEFSKCLVVYTESSEQKPKTLSFCNGIFTSEGGTHVNEWTNALFSEMCQTLNKKYKKPDLLTVEKVSRHVWIFIDAILCEPTFSSQSKNKLSGPKVPIVLEEKHVKKFMKWKEFVGNVSDVFVKKDIQILKSVQTKKRITKVDGLQHANFAGTKRSKECILVITEGNSAATYVARGTGNNHDLYGILPITGKILNTLKSSNEKIASNKVIVKIIQALNLEIGKDYTDPKNREKLNYGRLMVCADSDYDGYHIEGLVLCCIYTLAPTLIKNPIPFVISHRTPIIRCEYTEKKKTIVKNYYSISHFESEQHLLPKNATISYFKGLGTNKPEHIKETWNKRVIEYVYDERTDEAMNKLFGDDSTLRKKLLAEYDPHDRSGEIAREISVFLEKQVVQFSIEDCKRAIPNMMDGLKESHRKILYTMLKHNIKNIKVAQLAGKVAELTQYKHGEQNMYDTITKMAQGFVGSNNIPLLKPFGEFGSAFNNGSDAASARYIFCGIQEYTRKIFRHEDDDILDVQVDEGEIIEPYWYISSIPFVLCNGCSCGIGSGFSSNIPNYNIKDICNLTRQWIDCFIEKREFEMEEPTPWYRNYTGTIERDTKNRYITKGVITRLNDNVVMVESLPVGLYGAKFVEYLDELENKNLIVSYKQHGDPDNRTFEITENDGFECTIESLKLFAYISVSNIVCFNDKLKLQEYTIQSLIDNFCRVRLSMYEERIVKQLVSLNNELKIVKNRSKFLTEYSSKNIILYNQDDHVINQKLEDMNFEKIDDSYSYLLNMSFSQLNKKNKSTYDKKIEELEAKIAYLTNTPVCDIWRSEISEIETL